MNTIVIRMLFVYLKDFMLVCFGKVQSGPLAKMSLTLLPWGVHVDHQKQTKMSHQNRELQMTKQMVY